MLVRERMKACDFSNNERALVEFILEKGQEIKDMTTKEIARQVFASPSTLVRIAHKMNFSGWNELKEAFLKEEEYLNSHFQGIDANLPFGKGDSAMAIAGKIAALRKEAIDDTRSLLDGETLKEAVRIMGAASSIGIYAASNNLIIAREFQHNMARIGKKAEMCQLQGEVVYTAYLADRSSCALMVSYSGETPILLRCAQTLKKHKIPVIAITNIGTSSLAGLADCVLRICTRERQYSKIATFTTDSSIAYLLDVLYSCLFVLDYEKNLQMKIDAGRVIELGRESTVEIIRAQ